MTITDTLDKTNYGRSTGKLIWIVVPSIVLIIAAVLPGCHGNGRSYDLKVHKITFSSDEEGEKVAFLDLKIYNVDKLGLPDSGSDYVSMGTGYYVLTSGRWIALEDAPYPYVQACIDLSSKKKQRLKIDLRPLEGHTPGEFRIDVGPFQSDSFRISE